MLRIRLFEERCERLFRDAQVSGAMHLYAGQEAVAVGCCAALDESDALAFTYRSHGWALARGLPPVEVLGECLGRVCGTTRGRGGSKHIGDWSRRILPANAIVAGGLPLVTGVALADTLLGRNALSVAVFGDGSMNQGVLHETMTIARLWRLPVIFVCENNQYAELTPAMEMQPTRTLSERVSAHCIRALRCDGMDVEDVITTMQTAVDLVRKGSGPVFIEAETYRFSGHMTGDPQTYRTSEEVAMWKERDPIATAEAKMLAAGVPPRRLDDARIAIREELTGAEELALSSEFPPVPELSESVASWLTLRR